MRNRGCVYFNVCREGKGEGKRSSCEDGGDIESVALEAGICCGPLILFCTVQNNALKQSCPFSTQAAVAQGASWCFCAQTACSPSHGGSLLCVGQHWYCSCMLFFPVIGG